MVYTCYGGRVYGSTPGSAGEPCSQYRGSSPGPGVLGRGAPTPHSAPPAPRRPAPVRPQLPMSSSRDSVPPAAVLPGTRTKSRDWPKCLVWGWASAEFSPASTAGAVALARGDLPGADDARSLPCGAGQLTTGGIQRNSRALRISNQGRGSLRRAPPTRRALGAGWGTARSPRSPPYPAESAEAIGGPASPFYCARKPSPDIYRHGKSWERGGKR